MRLLSKTIVQAVALSLAIGAVYGQTPATQIEILVVQGEGVANQVRQQSAAPPVVRVQRPDGTPVAGAAVVFTLPTDGATGDFEGKKTTVVATDGNGNAAVRTLKVNGVAGHVPIHVTATYAGQTARIVVNQVSVAPDKKKPNGSGGQRRQ